MIGFVQLATERVVHHLATLPEQRASDTEGYQEVARSVIESMPEMGQPFETLLDLMFRQVLVKGYNTASPGTLSYVTGGGATGTRLRGARRSSIRSSVGSAISSGCLTRQEASSPRAARWPI